VFGPAREEWRANLSKLVVIITANDARPLMEATLRRCFRVQMSFLPPNIEADYLRKAAGLPQTVNNAIVRMAKVIRAKGESKPSLQEMRHLALDLKSGIVSSAPECEMLIQSWLCKAPADWTALVAEFKTPAATLWGELRRNA
jgi:hypothetical protein